MIIVLLLLVLITGYISCAEAIFERDWPRSTIKGFIIALLLLFAGIRAFGQASRYDNIVNTINQSAPQPGGLYPALYIPNSGINICTAPANAVPCTNYAVTYTNALSVTACPLTPTPTQLTRPNSSTCVAGSDEQGGWGVWMKSGNYQYTITTTYGSFGPYDFSVGGSGGGGAGNPGGSVYQIQVNNTTFAGSSVIIPVDLFTGATADAQINSCLNYVQTTFGGGTCDDSAPRTGTNANIIADPFTGITVPVTVKFGPSIYNCIQSGSQTWCMGPGNNSHLQGQQGTTFYMQSGSPEFYRFITPVQGAQNIEIDHITFNGNLQGNTNLGVQNHALFMSDQAFVKIHDNVFFNINGDGITNEGANTSGAQSVTSVSGNGTTETVTATGTAMTSPACVLYTYTSTVSVSGGDYCGPISTSGGSPQTITFPSSFVGTIGASGVVIPQNNANISTGVTTDGVNDEFFFSLAHVPIQPGSIALSIGSNVYQDNRSGQLIPRSSVTYPAVGTGCSYVTGYCVVLFNAFQNALTAAANASGGNTVYTGTITSGACMAGAVYIVKGFDNTANNGTFSCVSTTTGSITLANPSGVADTHAATVHLVPASGQAFTVSYSSGAQLGVTNFDIANNKFYHINRASISCISCRNGSIHSNDYDQDIQFNPVHWEPDASYQYGSNIHEYDDRYNTPGLNIALTVNGQTGNAQQCEGVNIENNWFIGGAVLMSRCTHSQFNHNHIKSAGNQDPLQVTAREVDVIDNDIGPIAPTSILSTAADGISYQCTTNTNESGSPPGTGNGTIAHNRVHGVYGVGISVVDCSNMHISDNTVYDIKPNGISSPFNTAWGIGVSAGTANTVGGSGIVVDGNIVFDDQQAQINYVVGVGGTVTSSTIVNHGVYTVAPTLVFGGSCGIAGTAALNGTGIGTVTITNAGSGCTPGTFQATYTGGTGGPTMEQGINIGSGIVNGILYGNTVSPDMLHAQITDTGTNTFRIANNGISDTVGGIGFSGSPTNGYLAEITSSNTAGNSPIDDSVTTPVTITSTENIVAPEFIVPATGVFGFGGVNGDIYSAGTNLVVIGESNRINYGNLAANGFFAGPTIAGGSLTDAVTAIPFNTAPITQNCWAWASNPITGTPTLALCDVAGIISASTSVSSPNASGSMKVTNLTVTGTCTGCTGAGTVNSVSNSDSTLTVTPTTGAVVASINLGNPNTWTGIQTFTTPVLGTPGSGVITNLTGTCAGCNIGGSAGTAAAISTNGSGFQVWGMDSGGSVQGWRTPVSGGVTSVATTGPITGGTITSTGTIACATCVTSAASLTNGLFMLGGGSQASATTAHLDDGVTTASTITSSEALVAPSATLSGSGIPISMGTASNTDLGGQLTLSGGTASYSFTATHTAASRCVATDTTAANAVQVVVTTTTLTINGTSTDVVDYICVGTTP